MAAENGKFIEAYDSLERARTFRNRWIAIGAGGVAVGASIGVLTGHFDIGAVIAVGSLLAVEGMFLDSQDAVNAKRGRLACLTKEHCRQPELAPATPDPDAV